MIQGGQSSSSSFYSYSQDVKPQTSTTQPPPRLYTCAICWKSFRHHFHLTAHHQTVHEGGGEKLFSCEVCGKAFAYSNSLTRHRLSQHGLTRTGQPVAQGAQGKITVLVLRYRKAKLLQMLCFSSRHLVAHMLNNMEFFIASRLLPKHKLATPLCSIYLILMLHTLLYLMPPLILILCRQLPQGLFFVTISNITLG